jgi:hypothetical protein
MILSFQVHQIWLQDILNPITSMKIIDFLWTNKHILNQFYIYYKCRFLGNKARHTQPIYIYNNHRFLRNKWTHPPSVYIYYKHRFLGNKIRDPQSIYIYDNPRFLRNKLTHPQSVYMFGKHRFCEEPKEHILNWFRSRSWRDSLPSSPPCSLSLFLPTYLPTLFAISNATIFIAKLSL